MMKAAKFANDAAHHPGHGPSTKVRIGIGDFALSSLESLPGAPSDRSERIVAAIGYYLSTPRSKPGWEYLRLGGSSGGAADIELEIREDLWLEFNDAAIAQRASVEQLLVHAILFYIAAAEVV